MKLSSLKLSELFSILTILMTAFSEVTYASNYTSNSTTSTSASSDDKKPSSIWGTLFAILIIGLFLSLMVIYCLSECF